MLAIAGNRAGAAAIGRHHKIGVVAWAVAGHVRRDRPHHKRHFASLERPAVQPDPPAFDGDRVARQPDNPLDEVRPQARRLDDDDVAAFRKAAEQTPTDKGQYMKAGRDIGRSEEHTSELQSLMRTSYAVFCSKKK